MSRYRRLRLFAVVALTIEFVLGLGGTLTPHREIFPFFSWFLFSLVPYHSSEYDLLIDPPDGDGPPMPFNRAGKFIISSHSIVAFQLIQQLGRAEEKHDRELVGRLRQQIEPHFRVPRLRYDLVKVLYAPIPRWTSGAVISRQPLATFTSGESEPETRLDKAPAPEGDARP